HLDTTMFASGYFSSPAEVGPAYRERLARLEDRIVLGSDFPNIPYPYVDQISGLAGLGLGDDWMRSVLWTNGAKLRSAGIRNRDEVACVLLESRGQISVIRRGAPIAGEMLPGAIGAERVPRGG